MQDTIFLKETHLHINVFSKIKRYRQQFSHKKHKIRITILLDSLESIKVANICDLYTAIHYSKILCKSLDSTKFKSQVVR